VQAFHSRGVQMMRWVEAYFFLLLAVWE